MRLHIWVTPRIAAANYLVDRGTATLFLAVLLRSLDFNLLFRTLIFSKCSTITCKFRITNDSIRIITPSSMLEPHRKVLHAFLWFASKGYRRSHTCIFTCSWRSVFKIKKTFFLATHQLTLVDNLTSSLSTFPTRPRIAKIFLNSLTCHKVQSYMPVKTKKK